MKNKFSIILLTLLWTSSFGQATKVDTAATKFRLCQYLLSCQSVAYTIIDEKDSRMKRSLASQGLSYYNKAYEQFIELQDPKYGLMSVEQLKNISQMLEAYAKIYSDISTLNQPTSILALSFLDVIYQRKILPELWAKK